jgi:hypothetical protein
MSLIRGRGLLLLALFAGTVLLLLEPTAYSQCSMCRASLAGSNNAAFIRNFNLGVLVLLVPPVAMFCSFFMVLRRHRLKDGEKEQSLPEDNPSNKNG